MSEEPETSKCGPTHHNACDRREALFSKAMETQRRVVGILAYSDDSMRLQFGELTAQEIRTVRAVLNSICGNLKVESPSA